MRPRTAALLLPILWAVGCGGGGSDTAADPPREAAPVVRTSTAVFDADTAWAFLVHQVEQGPRVPNTEAHRRTADWLVATLERFGGEVERQRFTSTTGRGAPWELQNVVGRFGPAGGGRLLLVAHWDSRPWADEDPDPANHERPVPGANDGASGVAVLLEVARHLGTASLTRGVDILFTDGEDLGEPGSFDGFCRGARHFASRGVSQYRRGVVVDLVGDTRQLFPIEGYSLRAAPEVVDWVWARGVALSPEVFSTVVGPSVYDDHMPLIEAGLPTVDIIDINYEHWHTVADDLRGVAPRSLETVGRVVLSLALDP